MSPIIYGFVISVFTVLVNHYHGCGVNTHIEIAHRALQYFAGVTSLHNYTELMFQHQDAFQAGSPYPDAYYSPMCEKGIFHGVSEDTHWGEFLNVSINYIRVKYPVPWDKETEKLVVFLLGIVSHQIADISWHSLGIDQGFIRTMSKVNFHDDYDSAHTAADYGGDIVNQYELDMEYIRLVNEWYIPLEDLYQIYKLYYDRDIMPRRVIEACTSILLLERLGEKLAIGKIFPFSADKSTFLVDMLNPYFLGGIDDMTAWTRYIWKDVIHMLEHGVGSCDLPHNSLFIHCGTSEHSKLNKTSREKEVNGYFTEPRKEKLGGKAIEKKYTKRGVYLKPSASYKAKFRKLVQKQNVENEIVENRHAKFREASSSRYPDFIYTSSYQYGRLGWSILTKDVNGDGHTDVILGAPGAGVTGNVTGMVFILLDNGRGYINKSMVVDKSANLTLMGSSQNGRFGHAIESMDINLDGVTDLIVGAPGVGSESLMYNGSVYVYFGTGKYSQPFDSYPNLIFVGQGRYLGLGWSLSVTGDFLIIGAPYASVAGGEQNGAVFVISSNKSRNDGVYHFRDSDALLQGAQNYSWFGFGVKTTTSKNILAVTLPTYRECFLANCTFSSKDTQSVGRVHLYNFVNGSAKFLNHITGFHKFDMLGSCVSFSPDDQLIALSASSEGVLGSIDNVTLPLNQAGSVSVYNLSSLLTSNTSKPIAQYFGDRMFSRFGHSVQILDVNDDFADDIVISAPLRTEDLLDDFDEVEKGRIFVFLSKNGTTPQGNVTLSCPSHSTVVPCTSIVADNILTTKENLGRLGSTVQISTFLSEKYLVAGSPHSNLGARLSGAVSFYKLH